MYIGNTAQNQSFTPQVDYFSGNASTTAFTLSRPIASTYQVLVHVANVTQNPSSAYTVTGNTITFASAPPSGTNNIWVQYTSLITQVNIPTNTYQVSGPVYTGVSAPLGGATNPITGSTGSANNYIQTYIYNTYNGVNSSADFTAYASNGTDASGWADMGITSPSFSQSAYSVTGPNEPYLFGSAPSGSGTSGNLVIATDSTGTTNAIQFYTGGFTKAKSAFTLMLDQNGNAGLGVTPSAWASGTGAIQMPANNSYSQYGVAKNTYYNGSNYAYIANGYATLYQQNSSGQHVWLNATSGSAGGSTTLIQAMTLDNSGRLLNTCSNNAEVALSTIHSGSSPQGLQVTYSAASPNNSGTGNTFLYCVDTSTVRLYISGNGGLNNYSANNTNLSDATMKKDIAPAKSYLSIINQIPVVTFLFNDQTDTELNLGATAQSVQAVAPELVGTIDVGTKEAPNIKLAIYETDLKYAMLKAIQELSAQVTALEAKVA